MVDKYMLSHGDYMTKQTRDKQPEVMWYIHATVEQSERVTRCL